MLNALDKRKALGAAACIAALGLTGFAMASCSLGLDEASIGRSAPGGGPGVGPGGQTDGAVTTETDSGTNPGNVTPPPIACEKNEDCKGSGGCLTATCDLGRKTCAFDVCRPSACNAGACNVASAVCGAPKPYKFETTVFPVEGNLGCTGAATTGPPTGLTQCFAAVYPFVFVLTTTGVIAYRVGDTLATAPERVPIAGLGFIPDQIAASGSRVFFVGKPFAVPSSPTPQVFVPFAYADIPIDPFVAKISATSTVATYKEKTPTGALPDLTLLARGGDTAFLMTAVAGGKATGTIAKPPFTEPFVLEAFEFTLAQSPASAPLVMSGARLATLGYSSLARGNNPVFSFVSAAGSANPGAPSAGVPITDLVVLYGAQNQSAASSPNGAVFFAGPNTLNPSTASYIDEAWGYFIFADSSAATFDVATRVKIDTYTPNTTTGPIVGPMAMLDANTVLVTTASPATPSTTSNVSFVTRQPLGLVNGAGGTPRRRAIKQPLSQLAAAGSKGFGYVLEVDNSKPAPTAQVHIFDPGCDP